MLSVGLYTLGCKVSQYETEAIGEAFAKAGFEVRDFNEINDVYVINTCTVTEESDRKSRQFIRRAIRRNPCAAVIVVGCYSQRTPSDIEKIPGVSVILGTQDKLKAPEYAKKILEGEKKRIVSVGPLESATFEKMKITGAPRTRAYVKIEDGCESKCTYCAIASARGPVRSKPVDDVVAEVEGLYRSGVREVVLTGIETGSYGKDFEEKFSLSDLLALLDKRKSCERIRLGSLAPELVGRDFAEKVKGLSILAPHFHISMQSGSDKVLGLMKRRYNSAMAYENIMRLSEAFPTAMFTTDLMVGFPGESDGDFELTLDFVTKVGFLDAHVFAYSRRQGTAAAEFPFQIPENVKRERVEALIKHKNLVRDRVLDGVVSDGRALSCIAEVGKGGIYTAHSDNFVELSFSSSESITGEMCSILPLSHKNGIVQGKLVKI